MTTILKRPSSPSTHKTSGSSEPKRIKLEHDVTDVRKDDDKHQAPINESAAKTIVDELNKLLTRPTGKDKLVALASLPDPLPTFEPICPQTTTTSCPLFKSPQGCPYPHYEPIIRPWTDSRLGQCSYLNMCYGESSFATNPSLISTPQSGGTKQCRYQHYRLIPPQVIAGDPRAVAESEDVEDVQEDIPVGVRKRIPKMSKRLRRALLSDPLESREHRDLMTQGTMGHKMDADEESEQENQAQWLNMDVRNLDAGVLGQFDLILADPPWDIHMNLPYLLLTDDDLRQLPIPSLQPDWGILALWVTGRAMELARELFGIWGYRRFDEIVWVKTGQLGGLVRTGRTGHWLNHTCEHLLLGIKLPPASIFPDRSAPIPWTEPPLARFKRGMDADVVVSEVRETSRKPDEVYGMLERMIPAGRKLEIFGRKHNTRPGWLTVGNQLGDSKMHDPKLKEKVEAAGILLDEATALANASAKTATNKGG